MNETEQTQLKERLMAVAKKEIRAAYRKSADALPAASTRIGGRPAVPEGFEWPYYTGKVYPGEECKSRPLSFLAQIDLKDVAHLDETGMLPKSGILSFFYELETMTWGYDPKDKGSARVYYFPEGTPLSPVDPPDDLEEYAILPELAMSFEQHISLPEFSDYDDGIDHDWDDYRDCCEECGYIPDDEGERIKLLGYPDLLQGSMEYECEAVSRGIYMGDGKSFKALSESEKSDIFEKGREWVMLFQMGTVEDGDYELMFGDCGHIYFWIRKQDLLECNFDGAWLIQQCG